MEIQNLTKNNLDEMISEVRCEKLSDASINSYSRTLKVFLSWCNEQKRTSLNISLYKSSETVNELFSACCVYNIKLMLEVIE